MDKRTEILKTLIENSGLNVKAFSEKAGLPYSTLRSILERGVSKTSIDNMIKICDALEIRVEDLQEISILSESNPDINIPEEYSRRYKVTRRDIIQRDSVLENAQAFMMDDKTDENDKEKLFEIVNKLYWESKAINKEKFKKNK